MKFSYVFVSVLLPISAFSASISVPRSSSTIDSSLNSGIKISLTKSASLSATNASSIQQELGRVQAKLSRTFNNFIANTGSSHPADKRTSQNQGTGVVALTDEQESLWQGSITVGTPGVQYIVDFDTGSSDLVLPLISCTGPSSNCDGHTKYNPSSSSTSVNLHNTTSSEFGDGSSLSGQLYNDTVTIAGLTAVDQTLIAATQYSSDFNIDNFSPDGLLGMAFQSLAESGAPPVFQTLYAEGHVATGVFSFVLADSGSELTLGATDPTKYTGSLTTLDVLTPISYWGVGVLSAEVNGRNTNTDFAAILDTGTTLLVTDPVSAQTFYSHISGSRLYADEGGEYLWSIPCNSKVGFTVNFDSTEGGAKFSVPDDDFILPNGRSCIGALTAIDGIDFWVLGDVFLRNVYTVFNVADLTVSLAKLA